MVSDSFSYSFIDALSDLWDGEVINTLLGRSDVEIDALTAVTIEDGMLSGVEEVVIMAVTVMDTELNVAASFEGESPLCD